MTRDDVIRMAVESGFGKEHGWEKYERFAALVAQQEREACAKVCDDRYQECMEPEALELANAIRARGAK